MQKTQNAFKEMEKQDPHIKPNVIQIICEQFQIICEQFKHEQVIGNVQQPQVESTQISNKRPGLSSSIQDLTFNNDVGPSNTPLVPDSPTLSTSSPESPTFSIPRESDITH